MISIERKNERFSRMFELFIVVVVLFIYRFVRHALIGLMSVMPNVNGSASFNFYINYY